MSDGLEKAEDEVLCEIRESCDCERLSYSVSVSGVPTHLRSLSFMRKNEKEEDNAQILYLHGTCASALGFAYAYAHARQGENAQKYRVHALDLPGFGRSVAPRDMLLNRSPEELIRYYITCIQVYIRDVMRRTEDQMVVLVGHSFGGYLACRFAAASPDLLHKLVLVNCVGMFPLLGRWTFYLGWMFSMGLPQCVLRSVSRFVPLLDKAVMSRGCSAFGAYYFRLLSCPHAYGDKVVRKFFQVNGTWARCDQFLLYNLFGIRVPVALIHGERDPIVPAEQGKVIQEVAGGPPCFVIPDAGHAPYSDDPSAFFSTLHQAICSCAKPSAASHTAPLPLHHRDAFKGRWSPANTLENVSLQYAYVRRNIRIV